MGIGGKISKAIKNPSKTVSGIGKKIDVSAGKTFYGNTVGFKNNRIGAKKSNPNSEFAKNEYLFLGNFYENSLIEKIRKRFSEIIEDDDHSVKMAFYEGKYYQRHLKRADLLPDVSKLLNDKLKKILEEYYGGHFKINHVDATRNYGVPEEIVKKTELFSSRYHCDNKRSDYTKLFVHLSDVTEDHGPYQSFSQKRINFTKLPQECKISKGKIEFKNVNFSFEKQTKKIFNNISFTQYGTSHWLIWVSYLLPFIKYHIIWGIKIHTNFLKNNTSFSV